MIRPLARIVRLALGAALSVAAVAQAGAAGSLAYPVAARGTVTDTYFGTTVADPYRSLEDVDSPDTKAWIAAENRLTRSFIDAIPQRTAIRNRLRRIWNYEKIGVPTHAGRYYFTYRNSGLQAQSVLYVSRSRNNLGHVLIDPNLLSKDGTVALGGTGTTLDGKYVAYATQSAGSDWQTWHVRDVATGRDLADRIDWSKFSGASWRSDDSGFYYARFDAPKAGTNILKAAVANHKLYFHKLGTPQSADRLVFARPDHPDWFVGGAVTDDGRWLLITANAGTDPHTFVFVQDLQGAGAPVQPLFPKGDAAWGFAANDGPTMYFFSDLGAPRGRLVSVDVNAPQRLHEIVPQGADAMGSVQLDNDEFYIDFLHDAHTIIHRYSKSGTLLGDVTLPGIGTSAAPTSGQRRDRYTFYSFSSFAVPGATYLYDTKTHRSTLFRRSKIAFDPTKYVTEQTFATSKDGTRVPIFVTYKKGFVKDGSAPTILYGYGGFDIPITPSFSITNAVWLELGGVYASVVLRGGSEYGEDWHRAGMLAKKQNVFDDYVAAAQLLIDQKYTSTRRLVAKGESNGGLLVGAAITQRPDLFGAALPGVGVMDMLRFQKFTSGAAWTSEYGSADASADQFATLYRYSPYQNIKVGTAYPATLVSTADHDDRVFPGHSFKFAAALQHAQEAPGPVLITIETNAGHGGGKPTDKVINEIADEYAFLVKVLSFDPTL